MKIDIIIQELKEDEFNSFINNYKNINNVIYKAPCFILYYDNYNNLNLIVLCQKD